MTRPPADLLAHMDRHIHPCPACGHRIYLDDPCGLCAVLAAGSERAAS